MDWATLAHESPDAAGFEASVLQFFQREVGFEAAFFSVSGLEGWPTVLGLDAATVKRAVAAGGVYAHELMPVKRAALAAHGVAVDTEVLGASTVRQTRYFREVAASVGGKHSLLAYLSWRGRVAGALMLGRAGRGFSSSEIRLVESLLPGLSLARAAFGLPCRFEPLRALMETTLLQRLGFPPPERALESRRGAQEMLLVRDRAGFREMVASDTEGELVWTRASLRDPAESGWPYIELFHVAAALAKQRRRSLFIGCGGAVALRQFATVYPGIVMDVVERDPAVIELARRWFALGAIPGTTVHVGDGVDFVARAARGAWDVAVVDAYGAQGLPSSFAQPAFFSSIRRALDPGGALAINVIGTLGARDVVRDVVRLASAEFASVRLLPVVALREEYAPDSQRNVVIVANGLK